MQDHIPAQARAKQTGEQQDGQQVDMRGEHARGAAGGSGCGGERGAQEAEFGAAAGGRPDRARGGAGVAEQALGGQGAIIEHDEVELPGGDPGEGLEIDARDAGDAALGGEKLRGEHNNIFARGLWHGRECVERALHCQASRRVAAKRA